jgi:phage terminase large subunit-like protein
VGVSLVEEWSALTDDQLAEVLGALTDDELDAVWRSWQTHARPEQLAPDWLWRWWVIVTGRGWGKNRTGAEWVVDRCEAFAAANMPHLVGLIGQNNDDVKALQIGGVSGIREVVRRRGHRWIGADSTLEPQLGIRREDGTEHISFVEVHTAIEPEGPRGRNFHTLWFDELAAYKFKVDAVGNTVFTNAELALRGTCPPGIVPQAVVTTTPKPVPVIRDLLAGKHGPTAITRGSLLDNRVNLPLSFIAAILGRYQGTRLAAQEIWGEIVDSVEGALWDADLIQNTRIGLLQLPELSRIVVAVDPSGSDNRDECGIVVVGLGADHDALGRQHVYVLDDRSCANRPAVWSKEVIAAYEEWNADLVVGEVNFGAALVVDIIAIQAPHIPFEEVRASRGKRVRAEPVATLYDRGQARAHHVGVFPQLEEQQCFWTPLDPDSPDRLDALVWGITYLIPDLSTPPTNYSKGLAERRLAA